MNFLAWIYGAVVRTGSGLAVFEISFQLLNHYSESILFMSGDSLVALEMIISLLLALGVMDLIRSAQRKEDLIIEIADGDSGG